MYDRRIVRGNTYAQHVLPAVSFLFSVQVACALYNVHCTLYIARRDKFTLNHQGGLTFQSID